MSKRPKTTGHRKGGRNRQFFDGLSGLARGLDSAIDKHRAREEPAQDFSLDKLAEAEAKRERRMAKNRSKQQ